MRLTVDGKLRPCLFSNLEIDLKPWLRGVNASTFGGAEGGQRSPSPQNRPDIDITAAILEAACRKPAGHGIRLPITDAKELPRIRFVGG
jgi:molybdenum cofactor biosynthesis enzyme MoaA